MAISLKHAFASLKSDGVDNSLVQPGDWNAEHVLTLAAFSLLGRGSGAGAAQEIAFDTIGVPVGTILDYGGASIPSKYLLCAGQAVSRATYADLFTAIGTTWGVGDGSTTFNLPDLRGRVTAGKDDMNGSDANRLNNDGLGADADVLGAVGGFQVESTGVTITGTASGSLSVAGTQLGDFSVVRGANGTEGPNVPQTGATSTITGSTTGTLGVTGSGSTGTAPNVQPTGIVNKMIKALAA